MTPDFIILFLSILGDSQSRQLYTSLLIFLSGGLQNGGLVSNIPGTMQNKCRREYQIFNHECRHYIPASTLDITREQNPDFCNTKDQFYLEYYPDFNTFLTSSTRNRIKELQSTFANSFIILSMGIHFNSNHNSFLNYYLKPIIDLKKSNHGEWPKLIVETLPTVPSVIISDARWNFRENVKNYCKAENIYVFDNFELTKNLMPYDGKHFGMPFHLLKVKILLNFLNEVKTICQMVR